MLCPAIPRIVIVPSNESNHSVAALERSVKVANVALCFPRFSTNGTIVFLGPIKPYFGVVIAPIDVEAEYIVMLYVG